MRVVGDDSLPPGLDSLGHWRSGFLTASICTLVLVRLLAVFLDLSSRVKQAWRAYLHDEWSLIPHLAHVDIAINCVPFPIK